MMSDQLVLWSDKLQAAFKIILIPAIHVAVSTKCKTVENDN